MNNDNSDGNVLPIFSGANQTPLAMRPNHLVILVEFLYGEDWKHKISNEFDVGEDHLSEMANGQRRMPEKFVHFMLNKTDARLQELEKIKTVLKEADEQLNLFISQTGGDGTV